MTGKSFLESSSETCLCKETNKRYSKRLLKCFSDQQLIHVKIFALSVHLSWSMLQKTVHSAGIYGHVRICIFPNNYTYWIEYSYSFDHEILPLKIVLRKTMGNRSWKTCLIPCSTFHVGFDRTNNLCIFYSVLMEHGFNPTYILQLTALVFVFYFMYVCLSIITFET